MRRDRNAEYRWDNRVKGTLRNGGRYRLGEQAILDRAYPVQTGRQLSEAALYSMLIARLKPKDWSGSAELTRKSPSW
jgi:hypothetical protein